MTNSPPTFPYLCHHSLPFLSSRAMWLIHPPSEWKNRGQCIPDVEELRIKKTTSGRKCFRTKMYHVAAQLRLMTPFSIMSARGQSSMFLAPKVRTKTGLFCGGRFRLLLGTFLYVHEILTFSLTSFKVLILCSSKMAYFTPYPDISIFSRSSNYVRFGPFNKCPRVIFCSLDEKTTYNIYHINKIRKFQLYL